MPRPPEPPSGYDPFREGSYSQSIKRRPVSSATLPVPFSKYAATPSTSSSSTSSSNPTNTSTLRRAKERHTLPLANGYLAPQFGPGPAEGAAVAAFEQDTPQANPQANAASSSSSQPTISQDTIDRICERIRFRTRTEDLPNSGTSPKWSMRRVNMLSTISPMLQARITRLKHNPGQHWIVVIDKDANGFTVDEAIQVLAWIGPDKANKRIRLSNLCTISNVMWFFEIIPKYFPACSSWEATNDDHRIIASSSEVYQTPPRSRTSHSSGSDENWYCWHSRTAHDSRMTALELTNIGLVLEWTDVFKREIKTVVWDWTGSEASVSQAVLSTPVELLKSNGNQGLDKQRRIEKEIILTYMRGYLDETDENNKPNINNIKLTKKDLNSHRMPLESTRFPQPSIYNMMKEIQTAILKPRRASGQVPPVPRTLNPNRPTTSGILGKIKKVEHDVELWFHGGEAHRRFVEKMLEDVHNFIERKQAELANSMLRWHETEVWKMDK